MTSSSRGVNFCNHFCTGTSSTGFSKRDHPIALRYLYEKASHLGGGKKFHSKRCTKLLVNVPGNYPTFQDLQDQLEVSWTISDRKRCDRKFQHCFYEILRPARPRTDESSRSTSAFFFLHSGARSCL